jgi:pimeloyl-ACP methyl ester carboxylesterase
MTTPVLIPGNMCDARLWTKEVRNALPGAVDADTAKDCTIAAMAERALASMTGKLLPIGFSLGAIIAVEMWVQAPWRIAGLALLGYNATADLAERAAHRPAQQAEVRGGGLARVLIEELKPNYVAQLNRQNRLLLDLLRDMGLALGPDVFVAQSEALRCRADRVAALDTVDVPVFYGCGAEDALCPPVWHEHWARLTRDSMLHIFEGAGHMLPLEAPKALTLALKSWISSKELT